MALDPWLFNPEEFASLLLGDLVSCHLVEPYPVMEFVKKEKTSDYVWLRECGDKSNKSLCRVPSDKIGHQLEVCVCASVRASGRGNCDKCLAAYIDNMLLGILQREAWGNYMRLCGCKTLDDLTEEFNQR